MKTGGKPCEKSLKTGCKKLESLFRIQLNLLEKVLRGTFQNDSEVRLTIESRDLLTKNSYLIFPLGCSSFFPSALSVIQVTVKKSGGSTFTPSKIGVEGGETWRVRNLPNTSYLSRDKFL